MHVGIIGGGPGGSVTAAALVRRGHRVTLWERERFPRFHIGESLLPTNLPVFADIGLRLEDHGFIAKRAAHFEQAAGGATVRFPFADGYPDDPPGIFQVERSTFDALLLDHAVACGAELRRESVVRIDAECAVIHTADAATEVDFVVDASGRDALLARQLGILDTAGDLKRGAVFGHVGALPLPPKAERGDIVISKAEAGWCWQIPLSDDKWSVGLVLKREAITGGAPEAVFRAGLAHFPEVAARLAGQVPDPVRSIPNISYRVRGRLGARHALVGDAGGFIDPIFSSGVLLATRAGWRLARALDEGTDLGAWAAATDHDLATFFAFIRLWYDGRFIDRLFFTELRGDGIYRGIIGLLAGGTARADNPFLAMLRARMAPG